MDEIRRDQFMTAYNETLGIVYAAHKGRLKVTTPEHAKAVGECLRQYWEGGMSPTDREKLESYMEASFREYGELPIKKVPGLQERQTLRRIELIVANTCNLNCRYCYAHGGNYGLGERRMLPQEAERYLRELLIGKYRYVENVTFFGGEPTLCPDTIKAVCEFFESAVQNGTFERKPSFFMVTNGTLIDEETAEMIHRFQISVTVSIDGPPQIHDLLRVDKAGRGTFQETSRGIRNLIDAGSAPVLLEATYTAKHQELGYTKAEIRDYLVRHFQIANVMVEDCTSGGVDERLAYTDRTAYDAVRREAGGQSVNAGMREVYVDAQPGEVRHAARCLKQKEISPIGCDAGFGTVALMPGGDLYPCHSFAGKPEYQMACFRKGHFQFAGCREVMQKFEALNKFENLKCGDCWAKAVCLFCPAQMLLEKDRECVEAGCHRIRESQRAAMLQCAGKGVKECCRKC